MPIHPPHAHLYDSVNLEVAKAKLGHAGRKSLYAPLNLVAYIDMMTMLVIFLLLRRRIIENMALSGLK